MYGGKAAAGLAIGLLALAGAAVAASSDGHMMAATSPRSQGVSQTDVSQRQFRGRIVSVRGSQWFWMRTSQTGCVRVAVGNGTRWSGNGCTWGAMRTGRHVYVHAYRQMGHWMASRVQPWRGGWDDGWGMMSTSGIMGTAGVADRHPGSEHMTGLEPGCRR